MGRDSSRLASLGPVHHHVHRVRTGLASWQTGRQGIAHQRIRMVAKQGIHGMSDDGRSNPDLRTMVRESFRGPSTAGRSFDRNRLMEPTDEQASRQSCMSDTLSSRSSNGTRCCVGRPHESGRGKYCCINEEEENGNRKDSSDSLWLLQSQEEHQVDRMQGIPSSVDSPTHPINGPPRQRKKCRRHREDDEACDLSVDNLA
jgi:hypothetical protein